MSTSQGQFNADQVVVASGGYHPPIVPRMAERLPRSIKQIRSSEYRNPQALPEGAVLVVGSGQSGAQIAEDLHLAGRKVILAVGSAALRALLQRPRCGRLAHRHEVLRHDMPVDQHPLREGVRDNTNHYVTGRDGGRDIDLRKFAAEGMELYGRLQDLQDGVLHFAPNLTENLDSADKTFNGINAGIDVYIEKHGIDAPPGSRYEPVGRLRKNAPRSICRPAG